jgi:hypothetical protein
LTCHSEEAQCRFAFLSPDDAVNLARNKMATLANSTAVTSAVRDPHLYDDPALGMRISLPDEWKLVRIEPGSFSRPRNAMFGKPGSALLIHDQEDVGVVVALEQIRVGMCNTWLREWGKLIDYKFFTRPSKR